MLRSSILRGAGRNVHALPVRRVGAAQLNASRQFLVPFIAKRFLADKPTEPPTTPKPASPTPTLGTGTANVAPPPETQENPTAPKKKNRALRLLVNLTILSVLGYGIAVYYALTSDNFHDFFTEYVPFGEDVVAYFEEREFRKRFASSRQHTEHTRLHPQVRGEPKVTIPSRAGVSVKDVNEAPEVPGRHVSAVDEVPHPQTQRAQSAERPTAQQEVKKEEPKKTKARIVKSEDEAKTAQREAPQKSAPAPLPLIDNLGVPHADEPLVQNIVKMLNDIIIVINADNASGKYASSIDKAKGELSKVISDMDALKEKESKAVEEKLRNLHMEFDDAAREMLRRQEQQMEDMEMRWREEYEAERGNLSRSYESKLKSELDSAGKVYDQLLQNELLKQAIGLRRSLAKTVQKTVENEREGRLGKLDELSSSVAELERLTSEWNKVVDATMNTQHLHVAVESVRAALEHNGERNPTPFIVELAALKEVASDNPVINAAIASVNPTAYQRGIPSSGQLIDRFRRVAAEVRKAALLPDNAGVASHAASFVLSKVMFKKDGLPAGNDVESILTRAEVLLEEGSLEEAVREVNGLTGWAKTLSRDWLVESRKVLEVRQALDVIAAEARLRSLLVD